MNVASAPPSRLGPTKGPWANWTTQCNASYTSRLKSLMGEGLFAPDDSSAHCVPYTFGVAIIICGWYGLPDDVTVEKCYRETSIQHGCYILNGDDEGANSWLEKR